MQSKTSIAKTHMKNTLLVIYKGFVDSRTDRYLTVLELISVDTLLFLSMDISEDLTEERERERDRERGGGGREREDRSGKCWKQLSCITRMYPHPS